MTPLAISGYKASWYPGSNRAILVLQLEDGRPREVPVENAAELAALVSLLADGPVYLNPDGAIVRERTLA